MSSSLYKCSYEECFFKSRTLHGIETHVRRCHSSFTNLTEVIPTKKARDLTVSRSRSFMRSKSRKVSGIEQSEGSSTLEVEKSAYNRIDIYNALVPAELHDVPIEKNDDDDKKVREGVEMIAKTFLDLSNLCSEKTVNEVITSLNKFSNDIHTFLETFHTVKGVKDYFKTTELNMIEKNGFRSETVSLPNGLQYKIYVRDPVEVLKKQISCTPNSKLFIKPTKSSVYSHPINSKLGNEAFREAEMFVKKSTDLKVKWKEIANDGEQSFIGGLQLFSDKSQVSLSAGALSFYPLHVTLVNYDEQCGREHITNGRTILAYLPASFTEADEENNNYREKRCNHRYEALSSLHESISFALQPLLRRALVGIEVKSLEEDRYLCHLLLSSYIADNPEAEDMLSVKRGVKTNSPCHRCIVHKSDMPFNTKCEHRTLSNTLEILHGLKEGEEIAEEKLKQLSMFPIPPVLYKFPMVGIHKSVDIYRIFRFEPMHNLSLGISKLLKECAVNLLKDEMKESTAMKTSNGLRRTFKNIKNSVLYLLNSFLHVVEISSAGYGLRVDFSKEGNTGRLSGFFNEQGIIGMIEASEYDSLDMVSPFLGSIIDRCCGNSNAEVTNSFTLYVDLVNQIFRRFKNPGWNEKELMDLSTNIKRFKKDAYNTFSKYQPSNMGTSKWHSLDHLVDDLMDVGSISFLHGGLYENFHKRFKEGYRLTSKRSKSAMEETLKRQDYFVSEESQRCTSRKRKLIRPNPSQIEASLTDAGILVRSGHRTSLNDLEIMSFVIHNDKKASETLLEPSKCAKSIASVIKEDGMVSLISMLHEKFEDLGIKKTLARHIPIQNPASAFISGYNTPSLSNDTFEDMVYIPKTAHRILQRVVAMHKFYGSKKDRRDCVMIEGCEHHSEGPSSGVMPIWFAQTLAFFRICDNDDENRLCEVHSRKSCPKCFPSMEKELCFVQFFDIVKEDELEVDEVDKKLNCIRLKWQRNEGISGKYNSSRQFGLVPVDSLRGLVHVVPADTVAASISKMDKWRSQYDIIGSGEEGWPSSIFYVNRFYRPRGSIMSHD